MTSNPVLTPPGRVAEHGNTFDDSLWEQVGLGVVGVERWGALTPVFKVRRRVVRA